MTNTLTKDAVGRRNARRPWSRGMLTAFVLSPLLWLAACEVKDASFFSPQPADESLFRSCTLVLSNFFGVPATMNVGDAASGQLGSTALAVLNGCDARRATYLFSSANPAVATVAQTTGSTPTNTGGVFSAPITVVAVGAGSTTLTGTITLDNGQTRTATVPVNVLRPQGNLTVTISGLPSGTPANVDVTQGTTSAGRLTATGTLAQLNTGSYTVTASTVTAADGTLYDATPATQQVTIVNQATANASVVYAAQVGSLRVTVVGLPSGAPAAVTVTRGGTTIRTVTESSVLDALIVGAYVVNASNVIVDGVLYAPTPTSRAVTVAKGTETAAVVTYAAVTGKLNIRISGLPAGVNSDVRVSLGATFIGTATGTTTLDQLTPGTYTLIANNVSNAGVVYVPSPPTQSVTVSAGSSPATASVIYAPQVLPTRISLTVTGLPAGSTPSVTITGPGFTPRTVNTLGPITIDVPAAGTYTVTAARYTVSPTEVYDPDVTVRQVVVAAQQTVNVTVPYVRLGVIEHRFSGLPANAVGPTGSVTNGTETQTFNGAGVSYVRPGTYDITLNAAIIANTTYRALTPLQRVTLGPGAFLLLTYVYYAAEVQYLLTAQTSIFSDPFAHQFFVNMFVTAVLRATLSNPVPSSAAPGLGVRPADPSSVIMTGPAPWITVSGPRDDDGNITLTGTGSAAGFSNVPARLTGVFTNTGGITGGRLQYGQSAAPTGLPNGPIIYNITATGAPASSANGFDAYIRQSLPAGSIRR